MKQNTCLLALVLASSGVFSPLALGSKYTIYGAGARSCGEWVTNRSSDRWIDMGEWMLGFITAAEYYNDYDLKHSDSEAFAVWMDNYCKQNPLKDLNSGAEQLVQELRTDKNH